MSLKIRNIGTEYWLCIAVGRRWADINLCVDKLSPRLQETIRQEAEEGREGTRTNQTYLGI